MTAAGAASTEKAVLRNARVFDGNQLSAPTTVVIEAGMIGTDPHGARGINCAGGVLLPGLIDCHVHLDSEDNLVELCSFGVTTALDMATWHSDLLARLRGRPAVTDIRSAGTPMVGEIDPNTVPGIAAKLVSEAIVRTPSDARSAVRARLERGSDYIKIMLGPAGPGAASGALDQPTVAAVVTAAHEHGKKVIAHALSTDAYRMAINAGVDVLTHVPLDQPLEPEHVHQLAAGQRVCVPTLTMMHGVAEMFGAGAFETATATVAALHRAGVPILAGTDANALPGVPVHIPHGQSIHQELQLLVAAGLSPTDALRAATSVPARHFGLSDRGAIQPGLRADLVLIDGDPTTDIHATRNITRVWCAGAP